MDLGKTCCGRVAKAQVNREVCFDLKVILNEKLRTLEAGVGNRLIGCAPLLDVAKHEIRKADSGGPGRRAILCRVIPIEVEITGL